MKTATTKSVPDNLFLAATPASKKGTSILDQLDLTDVLEHHFGPGGANSSADKVQSGKRKRAAAADKDQAVQEVDPEQEVAAADSNRPKLKEVKSILRTKYANK